MRANRHRAVAACFAAALALSGAAASAQPNPAFKYTDPQEAKVVEWKAQVRAGLLVTGGNSTLTNISGGAAISRNDGSNKVQLTAEGAYASATSLTDTNGNGLIDPGEEQSKNTVKRWELSLRYDRFFTTNNKGYLLGIVGANEIAGKDLYGGGQLGYSRQLYKSDMHEAVLEGGFDFSHERYVQPPSGGTLDPLNIFSLRLFLGDNIAFSKDTGLILGVEYLGNLLAEKGYKILGPDAAGTIQKGDAGVFEDSRVNAKAALSTKLASWLSLGLSFSLRFDNVPALRPGFKVAAEKIDTTAEASLIVNLL